MLTHYLMSFGSLSSCSWSKRFSSEEATLLQRLLTLLPVMTPDFTFDICSGFQVPAHPCSFHVFHVTKCMTNLPQSPLVLLATPPLDL